MVYKRKIKFKKKYLALTLIPLLPVLCVLSVSAARVICDIEVPSISIEQSITSFVDENTYDADTLVLAAQSAVKARMSSLQHTRLGFVLANYICQENDCNLERLNVEITGMNSIGCPLPNDFPLGYDAKTVFFLFKVNDDLVTAITASGANFRKDQPGWEDISIHIADAVRIAYQARGDAFARQYPTFGLSAALKGDNWEVDFNSDLTEQKPPQARILIDCYDGSVTVEK